MPDFIMKTIPLMGLLSYSDKKLKPTGERFQKFIEMATKKDTQLVLPTNDEMNLVDSLRSQYSTLKETHNTQRPSNFWDQMDVLNNRIKALEPKRKQLS